MSIANDWPYLLGACCLVGLLVATAYSVGAITMRGYRTRYSLISLCECRHSLGFHSRRTGRCLVKADADHTGYNCICVAFLPARTWPRTTQPPAQASPGSGRRRALYALPDKRSPRTIEDRHADR